MNNKNRDKKVMKIERKKREKENKKTNKKLKNRGRKRQGKCFNPKKCKEKQKMEKKVVRDDKEWEDF